jgi:3-hydroxypropanoate dehydrogenase
MNSPSYEATANRLFMQGRSFNAWQDKPIPDALLEHLYLLTSMGPTSANCCPARIVFVTSQSEKQRLLPALDEGNRSKTMGAPVTAVIGYDMAFAEQMPILFPHAPDARNWFSDENVARTTAFRNGSMQGGYFILAARTLGLDCGPMSGFDAAAVNALYFAGTSVETNFLCNLGYGDPASLFPRSPRLPFATACRVV